MPKSLSKHYQNMAYRALRANAVDVSSNEAQMAAREWLSTQLPPLSVSLTEGHQAKIDASVWRGIHNWSRTLDTWSAQGRS